MDARSLTGRKKNLKTAFESSYAHDKEKTTKVKELAPKLSFYRRAKLYQFKALVIKEFRLHSKQVFANLCQVDQ